MENKQEILNRLADTLNQCRITNGNHIMFVYHEMDNGEKIVDIIDASAEIADTRPGTVNVTCDSGIAMIRDVLKHPYFS